MPDRRPVTQEQVAALVEDQYQGEAVRNILRGVATLSQYARFFGEEKPSVRRLYLPRIPALIAREAVGPVPSAQAMHWTELVWQRLVAYPPGTKVPSPILADMDRVVNAAVTVPKHGTVMPAEANLRQLCAVAHGRLKARLRPMRGLKSFRSVRILVNGHAFVQNLRRGHYDIAADAPDHCRVRVAFDELALAI